LLVGLQISNICQIIYYFKGKMLRKLELQRVTDKIFNEGLKVFVEVVVVVASIAKTIMFKLKN
jgi:hypothetical protein